MQKETNRCIQIAEIVGGVLLMKKTNRQMRGGYLIIKNATKHGYLIAHEGDGVDISTRMEYHRGTVQKGMSLTIKTTMDVGVVVK